MLATQDVWTIDPADEDTSDRRERLIAEGHVLSLMQLSFARQAAEFAATNDHEENGTATSIDWIRIHCHMTGPAAADYVSSGEHVSELRRTSGALAEGNIGFGHMVAMSRSANALSNSPSAPAFDESRFLKSALENTVGKFHHICRHARHAADPKGYVADEVNLVENRCLKMSTWDDGAVLQRTVVIP